MDDVPLSIGPYGGRPAGPSDTAPAG